MTATTQLTAATCSVPTAPATARARTAATVTTTGTTSAVNPVLATPPAPPAQAAAYFAASLAFHTDVSDVAAALAAGGDPGFTLLDTRGAAAWDQSHIPGALHLPTALIEEQAGLLLDRDRPVVVHCWGPACNGATRAALALATLGYQVKEMLGGMEYWIREGLDHESAGGTVRQAPDPLTAPAGAADCGC